MHYRTPLVPDVSRDNEKTLGATLSEEEMKQKIQNREINANDMSIQQRSRFEEELKKARRF